MASNESGSNVQFSPDTKEESIPPASNMEEGIPQDKNVIQRRTLSEVSKQYDANGDGKLDEAEQAMRNLDTEGRGYLTNDKVLSVFQQQLRMQKQLLLAKRLLFLFAVLLIILAVANIAVAFIAARLSKETTTRNDVLIVKDSGKIVATNNHADVYGIQTSVDTERRAQVTRDGSTTREATTVSLAGAQAMFTECAVNGVSVKLNRKWSGYDFEDVIELCPGLSYSRTGKKYTYVLMSRGRIAENTIIEIDCQGNVDPCTVTGNGLLQIVNEPCVFDSDCESNTCVKPIASDPGVCKLPLGADCRNNADCEFKKCQPSQAFGSPGSCTCNPTDDKGCAGTGETCFSASEQQLATSIVDVGPRCMLPVGASCAESFECLTDACVSLDGSDDKECVCSSNDYPCDTANGETCVNGTCQVSTGTQTTSTCAPVPADSFCFSVFEPVKCGDCCYSNPCRAIAAAQADSSFDASSCATPADGECPDGSFV